MSKSFPKFVSHLLISALFGLAAGPVLAAELRLIGGEYRYYENGELLLYRDFSRALPDDEQVTFSGASASVEPTEDDPERTAIAIAESSWTFEIEPDPDTDEQVGDPVCVVTLYGSEVEAQTEGATSAASASGGGWNGTASASADESAPPASAATSAPGALLRVNPNSNDELVENTFESITVSGDAEQSISGEHHFIALIGDFIGLQVGSYAASAAIYPDTAAAWSETWMQAELPADILDCQLTLTAVVATGNGSIQISSSRSTFQFGDEVQLSALPEQGWNFSGWSGDAAGMDNPLSLTIVNNTEIFASFEIATYTVTAEVGDGNGQITPLSQNVDHGADAGFTVMPDPSWSVASVTGDTCNPVFDADDQWIAQDITEDCTVVANFEIDTFTIGGTLSGLSAGNRVTLQNNNTDVLILTTNGDFTFSAPLDDLTTYGVTVFEQPDGQLCSVTNASGTLAGNDVDDVAVECADIELTLSLSDIQFAALNPGDSDDQVLTLTNTGQVDLVIEQFIAPGPPFGFDALDCEPLPRTLTLGQSCTVTLSFEPQTAGNFNDELVIVSTAPSSPDNVGVSGNAALPPIPVPTLGLPALLLLLIGVFLLGLRPSLRIRKVAKP
ncbi:MAG: choice-of-anchor D domain-containing protein [Wenzhouxiangella sp.]|nr:choice-of-anchor D domain-containing protein [Wenzhouxiangella sp.]